MHVDAKRLTLKGYPCCSMYARLRCELVHTQNAKTGTLLPARRLRERAARSASATTSRGTTLRSMQRANQAVARTMAASAATAALVAPVSQLMRSADDAKMRVRLPRALELYERALALAETTMPESTLLTIMLLRLMISTRMALAAGSAVVMAGNPLAPLYISAWRDDEQLLRLSARLLGLLRGRWAAGTLLTPTPEEACFAECIGRTGASVGVESFVAWAKSALFLWPHEAPLTLADGAQCLHGIHEALSAVVEMWRRDLGCGESTVGMLHDVLHTALDAAGGPWLPRLRATCGLSQADEAKLRDVLQNLTQGESARQERSDCAFAAMGARAAADVARHGLRSCALPSCGATEQYPKTYKLCGRCRGAAYCCAAHSKEDWKRHKREDGCAAPP